MDCRVTVHPWPDERAAALMLDRLATDRNLA
jgi:hypothetical protein